MRSFFQNFSRKFLFLGLAAAVLLILLGGRALRDGSWSTQVAQVGSVSQEVSALVRISDEVNCEDSAAPITRVYFDIKPQEGGVLRLIDHGMVRQFGVKAISEEAPLDGWFFNGDYIAQLEVFPGYTVTRGFETVSFSINADCNKSASLPSSTLPPPLPATDVSTTSVASLPTPVVETTPPPAPKVESAPRTTSTEPPPASPVLSDTATEEAEKEPTTSPIEACGSEEECQKMCAQNDSSCTAYTTEIILEKPVSGGGASPSPAPDVVAVENYIQARDGVRMFADADSDGIVDFDEVNIFGTDPRKADSDNDGISDSDELIAHTDPVSAGTTTAIVFEDPSQYGAVTATSTLGVTTITAGEITNDASGTPRLASLILSGHGPANAYITLYIYSEPIVVTVKTDRSGAWTYALKQELPDGTHKVYTALTDNGGRVLAKSEPLPFVKQASAISIGNAFLPAEEQAPSFFGGMNAVAMISLLAAVVLASVIVLGIFVRTRNEDTGGTPGMA